MYVGISELNIYMCRFKIVVVINMSRDGANWPWFIIHVCM